MSLGSVLAIEGTRAHQAPHHLAAFRPEIFPFAHLPSLLQETDYQNPQMVLIVQAETSWVGFSCLPGEFNESPQQPWLQAAPEDQGSLSLQFKRRLASKI